MLLDETRVVDDTQGIAGPYSTKLLVDAGADVVRIESPGGDPLRERGSGALFEYLNAGKRVTDPAGATALIAEADLYVTARPPDLDALWSANPSLVVLTVTSFGLDGPWADRPATEFTLQAASGSTATRGLLARPPLAAGGRLGEWLTGAYAGLGAAAALFRRAGDGRGTHIDVAVLDVMAVTMVPFPSVFAEFLGWPPQTVPSRAVEVPSIEPTANGFVAFTTNSPDQFAAFCLLVGRPELASEPTLASPARRSARRDWFLEEVVHPYTRARTTEQLLAEAADLRIPAAPVLDGSTIPGFEQFRARDVLVPSRSGRFVQPRVPYRVEGRPRPAPGPLDVAADGWRPRAATTAAPPRDPSARPLEGVRIVDCTAWWAGPSAVHALAALGADVVKIESAARPDLMRYTSVKPPGQDRWWEWGPLFHAINTNKRGVTLDLGDPRAIEVLHRLLAGADVLVENFTPRVLDKFGLTWDDLHARHPQLVLMRMPAFGLDGPWRDRTGFAQTMECVTGMAFRTGFVDGLPTLVRGACDPVAGIQGAFALLVALGERDRTGTGVHVEVAMVEAALNVAAEPVVEWSAAGALLARDGYRGPDACPQGVYACAGDESWVAIAVVDDGRWGALRTVLDDPAWAADPGLASAPGRRARHDEIDAHLGAWCRERSVADVVDALVGAGIAAADVINPRDIASNPQLRHRGLFEVEDHPVTGRCEVPGFPLRFRDVDGWVRFASPTLGQHNDEVLAGLGYADDDIAALAAAGVIGDRLAAR